MVDQVSSTPRTRRAVLAAAAAAGAATVANAIAKPLPVAAAGNDGQNITVGAFLPDARSQTTLANNTSDQTLLWVASNDDGNGNGSGRGNAIVGYSTHGRGVSGQSQADGVGVYGESNGNTAVYGISNGGTAVFGGSNSNYGVWGSSISNVGVYARSATSTALDAYSSSGIGARLGSGSATLPAVIGRSAGGSTGVQGYTSDLLPPAARAATGVMGTAPGPGTGGYFESASGNGGQFKSATGNAIRVEGKASFTRAGRVNIPKNRAYVDITVAGGLASSAAIVATLQTPRTGVWVTSVRVNYPSAGKARIQLNKVASATASTAVGFFVIG